MSCLDVWLPLVQEHCGAACPDDLVERHLVRAAREFCERTLAWQQPLQPIESVAGSATYALPLPTACVRKCSMGQSCAGGCGGSCDDGCEGCSGNCPGGCSCERVATCEVVRVLRVDVGLSNYAIRSGPGSRSVARNKIGNYRVVDVFGPSLTLTPVPVEDGVEIVADVALKPRIDASCACIPDLLTPHAQGICLGASASILGASSYPWANPAKSAELKGEFLSYCVSIGARVGWSSSVGSGQTPTRFF